jgi:hypothetical protein
MSREVCYMQTMEIQSGLRNFSLNSDALVCSWVRDTRRFSGNPPDDVTMHLSICPTTKFNVRTTNSAAFIKKFTSSNTLYYSLVFYNRSNHAEITVMMCGMYALCMYAYYAYMYAYITIFRLSVFGAGTP